MGKLTELERAALNLLFSDDTTVEFGNKVITRAEALIIVADASDKIDVETARLLSN